MTAGEIPADDEHYWEACDSFVGGNSFLRVLGPPIWLQWVEEEICGCGRVMHYFAGIGYEDWNSSGTFLEEEPFIGQMRQPRIGVLGRRFVLEAAVEHQFRPVLAGRVGTPQVERIFKELLGPIQTAHIRGRDNHDVRGGTWHPR
jgi:hypothetical protein